MADWNDKIAKEVWLYSLIGGFRRRYFVKIIEDL